MGKKIKKQNSHAKQKKTVSLTKEKGTFVQKKHKDTLFRFIFSDREKLLQLYNALRGTAYENPEALTITTLENVIYLGYKNDISFLLDSVLFLAEHQGSWNPNMPLRGLPYFSRLYMAYIAKKGYNLYGSKKVWVPYPQYVVFYNGTDLRPEREILRLSESYQKPKEEELSGEPALECRTLVLNINYGKNRELMEKCRPLLEYSKFVHYIREYLTYIKDPEEAVDMAVERCLSEEILTDVLRVHRKEVIGMFLEEFDEEFYKRAIKQEAYEDGFEAGQEDGRNKAMEQLGVLVQRLLEENRQEDLKRAVSDREFQQKLLKKYKIL